MSEVLRKEAPGKQTAAGEFRRMMKWIVAIAVLMVVGALAFGTYQVPILDFRGTPTGIDVTKVVRTGLLPVVNTGIAGRVAGTGQVGAGLAAPPAEVFTQALRALAEEATIGP